MMKNTFKITVAIMILGVSFLSCKKKLEGAVDCFGESLVTSVHVTVSADNPKAITGEIKYYGSKMITNVDWEFGDGTTASNAGREVKHVYTTGGTYTLMAKVTFTEGKSSCEVDPTKSVTIQ